MSVWSATGKLGGYTPSISKTPPVNSVPIPVMPTGTPADLFMPQQHVSVGSGGSVNISTTPMTFTPTVSKPSGPISSGPVYGSSPAPAANLFTNPYSYPSGLSANRFDMPPSASLGTTDYSRIPIDDLTVPGGTVLAPPEGRNLPGMIANVPSGSDTSAPTTSALDKLNTQEDSPNIIDQFISWMVDPASPQEASAIELQKKDIQALRKEKIDADAAADRIYNSIVAEEGSKEDAPAKYVIEAKAARDQRVVDYRSVGLAKEAEIARQELQIKNFAEKKAEGNGLTGILKSDVLWQALITSVGLYLINENSIESQERITETTLESQLAIAEADRAATRDANMLYAQGPMRQAEANVWQYRALNPAEEEEQVASGGDSSGSSGSTGAPRTNWAEALA